MGRRPETPSAAEIGTVMRVRHTLGLVCGVLLTPVLIYGVAWSFAQATGSFDPVAREITDDTRLQGGVALMGAAGLAMGVVVVARWASPLLSMVPALTLIGWSVYFFVAPDRALTLPSELPPDGPLGHTVDSALRMLLGSGVFALLGFLLLVPTGTPRRWAGRHGDDHDEEYGYDEADRDRPRDRPQPEFF